MLKRKIVLGAYDTAAHGWTLSAWALSPAEEKTNFVDRPGGDGSWDLSTALTDGVPRFKDRTLSATLECSNGTRLSREAKIDEMVNQLSGMRLNIELPDDPDRYLVGKIHVARESNDGAHAAVTVTAVCEPWKYSAIETVVTLEATTSQQTAQLVNNGRRVVVPVLTIEGDEASVQLEYGTDSGTFAVGTYKWPELLLQPGAHVLRYSGSGAIHIAYREARL